MRFHTVVSLLLTFYLASGQQQSFSFPKVIGFNNDNTISDVACIDYNEPTNRMAAIGKSQDPLFCGSKTQCQFLIVYEGTNMDIKWSKVLIGKADDLTVSFTKDGSLLGFVSYQNDSISLIEASTGNLRLQANIADIIPNYQDLSALPSLKLGGSANSKAEVYIHVRGPTSNDGLKIVKLLENSPLKKFDMVWIRQVTNSYFFSHQSYQMDLIIDEDNKIVYSASNNLDSGVNQKVNAFLALNSATGNLLWAYKYPAESLQKFDIKYVSTSQVMIIAAQDYKIVKFIVNLSGTTATIASSNVYFINSNNQTSINDLKIISLTKAIMINQRNSVLENVTLDFAGSLVYRTPIFNGQNFKMSKFRFANYSQIFALATQTQSLTYLTAAGQQRVDYNSLLNFIFTSNRNAPSLNVWSNAAMTSDSIVDSGSVTFTALSSSMLFSTQSLGSVSGTRVFKINPLWITYDATQMADVLPSLYVSVFYNTYDDQDYIFDSQYGFEWVSLAQNDTLTDMSDFLFEIQHSNGTFKSPKNIQCFYNPKNLGCQAALRVLRQEFGLNSTSYLFTPRVRRLSTKSSWIYPNVTSRTNILYAEPDTLFSAPIKTDNVNSTSVELLMRTFYNWQVFQPALKGYELMMRDTSLLGSDFVSVANFTDLSILPTGSTFTYKVTGLASGVDYQFAYRGFNGIGSGVRSNYSTYMTKPMGKPASPKVYFNKDKVIVEISNTGLSGFDHTKPSSYYQVLFTDVPASSNPSYGIYKSIQDYCGLNQTFIKTFLKCEIPILRFKQDPVNFASTDTIYVIVQACNSGGCSFFSDQNVRPFIQVGAAPTRGVSNLKIGDLTKRTNVQLLWDSIDYSTDSQSGKNPINYRLEYQVAASPLTATSVWDTVKVLTLSTDYVNSFSFFLPQINSTFTYGNIGQYGYRFTVQPINQHGNGTKVSVQLQYSVPNTLPAVTSGLQTNSSFIQVKWKGLTTLLATGYDKIISYEVFACQVNSTNSICPGDFVMIKNQSFVAAATDYSFVHNTNRPGSFFLYKVRVRNSFGVSDFSTQVRFGTIVLPKVVQPVVVSRDGVNVTISWLNSFNENGLPILGYDMQLNTSAGKYQFSVGTEIMENLCDLTDPDIFAQKKCSFSMIKLVSDPFNQQVGSQVNVYMRASNEGGNSSFTTNGAASSFFVSGPPKAADLDLIFLGSKTNVTQAELKWKPLGLSSAGYENITAFTLYMKQGETITELITAVPPNYNSYSYIVQDLIVGTQYEFYYSATNIMGTTFAPKSFVYIPGMVPFSSGEDIHIFSINGTILFDWYYSLQPSEYLVTDVAFYGKSSSGNWLNINRHVVYNFTTMGSQALLSIKNLLGYPLFLDIDDYVQLYMTFKNINGWSSPIAVKCNYCENIQKLPIVKISPQIRVPNFQVANDSSSNNIHLTWSLINSSPANGGDPNVDYIVYWGLGSAKDPWYMLTPSTKSLGSIQTLPFTGDTLIANQQYKFMVSAYNYYGNGPNSTIAYYTVPVAQPSAAAGAMAAGAGILSTIFNICS